MKKMIIAIFAAGSLVSFGAFAGGNGSGNPKNDLGYNAQYDQNPHFIWKDGKLVKNPDYNTGKKKETTAQK